MTRGGERAKKSREAREREARASRVQQHPAGRRDFLGVWPETTQRRTRCRLLVAPSRRNGRFVRMGAGCACTTARCSACPRAFSRCPTSVAPSLHPPLIFSPISLSFLHLSIYLCTPRSLSLSVSLSPTQSLSVSPLFFLALLNLSPTNPKVFHHHFTMTCPRSQLLSAPGENPRVHSLPRAA